MEALGNGSWILRKESFEIITALNQESSTTPKFLLRILHVVLQPLNPLTHSVYITLSAGNYNSVYHSQLVPCCSKNRPMHYFRMGLSLTLTHYFQMVPLGVANLCV